MNNIDINLEDHDKMCQEAEKSQRRGKICGGFLIVVAGVLFLAKELGAEIPYWIFSWKTFLIAIGLMIAVKYKFRHAAWVLFIGVGGLFLLTDFYPGISIKPFLWPAIIILIGLFIMFKPHRRHRHKHRHWHKMKSERYQHHRQRRHECFVEEESVSDDFVDSTTVMGGVKKNILSKNFKGGDITIVFGGAELNLVQADFEKKAVLELTQVFGGTKLIIPANWEIKSELVSVFGNIEDTRPVNTIHGNESLKVLVLKGTTFFGGIEISSY